MVLALAAGCGHRVEPTEPFRDPSSLPVPADVTATQVPGAVILSWSAGPNPYEFVDGWNVYRRTTMDGPRLRINPGLVTDVSYADSLVSEGASYFYSLRSVSPAGLESEPTHDLEFRYDSVAPAAPAGLVATPQENAIRLRWSPVAAPDLAFYRLYRDGALRADLVTESQYLDMPVAADRSHTYEVTAVDERRNESPRSAPATATALAAPDTLPPPAPSGLTATLASAGVRLAWDPVAAPDLLGYLAYRRLGGEATFARVPGTSLVTTTMLVDDQLQNGETYVYVVTAVDTSGNESDPSTQATAQWVAPVVDTGGNTLGSVYPWCGIVVDSGRMQFLVPAADIGRSGRVAQLGLWIRSGAAVYHNVSVSLAHTSAAALESAFDANRALAEPLAAVFGPASIDSERDRDGFILPLAFTTGFEYDGAHNLLVEITWNGDDRRTAVFGFGPRPGVRLRLWQQPIGGATQGYEQNQQFLRFVFAD